MSYRINRSTKCMWIYGIYCWNLTIHRLAAHRELIGRILSISAMDRAIDALPKRDIA